jgi:hypothetical protein
MVSRVSSVLPLLMFARHGPINGGELRNYRFQKLDSRCRNHVDPLFPLMDAFILILHASVFFLPLTQRSAGVCTTADGKFVSATPRDGRCPFVGSIASILIMPFFLIHQLPLILKSLLCRSITIRYF